MRTRIMNQIAGVGDERGLSLEEKLFSEQGRALLEKLSLAPASRRRQELLELLDCMNPTIAELTAAVEREARKLTRGAATDDASRCGSAYGPRLC